MTWRRRTRVAGSYTRPAAKWSASRDRFNQTAGGEVELSSGRSKAIATSTWLWRAKQSAGLSTQRLCAPGGGSAGWKE